MKKLLRTLALSAIVAAPSFYASAAVAGSGTAEDPYQIATAADIEDMHNLVKADEMVYFVQTADIDMSGVTTHYAPVGATGQAYNFPLNYDGRNHVIKNFAPTNDAFTGTDCYAQSVFGVFSGELKNLGIVDINLNAANNGRAGAIGGYLGQSAAKVDVTKVSNVYVTGKIVGGATNYTGGLFGTTGTAVELNNCYVNVEMVGTDGGKNAAFAGRLNNPATINNCYIAGTVSGNANLVCAQNNTASTINGLVVFATGSETTGLVSPSAEPTMANSEGTKAAGVEEVLSWSAFQANGEGLPTLKYVLYGAGTAADPYQIGSADDLCHAYKYVNGVAGGDFYFVQTADIDMEGVTEYHAIAGYDGAYKAHIYYDGKNHIIRNFAPNDFVPIQDPDAYYCTSIFGIPAGEISNLGVIDATCQTKQGAGILGAYAGHADANMGLTLKNVFVHGIVAGAGGYTGGMFGTTHGGDLTMVDCFANVEVSGKTYTAGVVGRLRNTFNAENVYVAGTVDGAANSEGKGAPCLFAGTDKTPAFDGLNVIAFNTGADAALASAITVSTDPVTVATPETEADLIAEVHTWPSFSATKNFEGYPALAEFENITSGITDVVVKDEAVANGPAVYYNLQGVRVANPENGLYIRVQGKKVSKVYVK